MTSKIIILTLFSFSCIPLYSLAHGNGASYEEIIDGKRVDIGYSSEEPEAREPVRFDFTVLDTSTQEGLDFTDVWVQVHQDRELFFAGGIHRATFGTTGLTFTFPEKGMYEISARFQNDTEIVVGTSFPLMVSAGAEETSKGSFFGRATFFGIGGILVGFILGAIVNRRRKYTV